jgi:predicted RNA polymerase sigma factor
VRRVLYLVFNEGYTSSAGPALHRAELSAEAIRLARLLHAALPDDGETTGLLSLLLLTDARRPARTGPDGDLVPLADQDRTRWDRSLIREGISLATAALARDGVGEYRLQAAIAATHDMALRAEDTDWPRILTLYTRLEAVSENPVVTLNRAIATAMVHGPAAGLDLLRDLDARLPEHHRLAAARAHLLDLSGNVEEALRHYDSAAARTANTAEQRYLLLRAARLRATRSADRPTANPE